MSDEEPKWLDDGDVHIMLPEPLVAAWHGIRASDCERACAASDEWLSLVPVGDAVGIVLGGDPGMVMVVPDDRGEVVIIRWMAAEDEAELIAFALRGEDVVRSEPDLELDNPVTSWRLFNAAADLPVDDHWSLRLTLPVGRVRVTTAYLESERNAAIVHRFSKGA